MTPTPLDAAAKALLDALDHYDSVYFVNVAPIQRATLLAALAAPVGVGAGHALGKQGPGGAGSIPGAPAIESRPEPGVKRVPAGCAGEDSTLPGVSPVEAREVPEYVEKAINALREAACGSCMEEATKADEDAVPPAIEDLRSSILRALSAAGRTKASASVAAPPYTDAQKRLYAAAWRYCDAKRRDDLPSGIDLAVMEDCEDAMFAAFDEIAAVSPAPTSEAKECCATGAGHSFKNVGPNSEEQCEFCGDAPTPGKGE